MQQVFLGTFDFSGSFAIGFYDAIVSNRSVALSNRCIPTDNGDS